MLFHGNSTCEYIETQEQNSITEIGPTNILLNNVNTILKIENTINQPLQLKGSYIINYENTTLQLFNRTFSNQITHTLDLPTFKQWLNPRIAKKLN